MTYEQVEDAIVSRLIEKLGSDAEILALPEYQSQNTRPFVRPRIVVAYAHSMFGEGRYGDRIPTKSTMGVIEEENFQIKVSIESRQLRGATGVYSLMRDVRQALMDFEPLGLDKIKILENKFDEFTDDLWCWNVMFGTKGLVISDLEEPDDPLITQVQFVETFNVDL